MSDRVPRRFSEYVRRADQLVNSGDRLRDLVTGATGKLSAIASTRIDRVRDQLNLCIALVRSWVHGEYDGISRQALVAVTAALLYFVVPFDVVPDFLLGLGFVDDAAVVGYVMTTLAAEMDTFRRWQERNAERQDDVAKDVTKNKELV